MTIQRGFIKMTKETFNQLELEKQVEIYNQWLCDTKLDSYTLYTNDNDGLETLFDINFYILPTADIVQIMVNYTHYDISDSLVTFDYDDGFRSLDDRGIKERFSNIDFLDWLDGQRLGNYL